MTDDMGAVIGANSHDRHTIPRTLFIRDSNNGEIWRIKSSRATMGKMEYIIHAKGL
jgi:hypothetical protein